MIEIIITIVSIILWYFISKKLKAWDRKKQSELAKQHEEAFRKQIEWEERIRQEVRDEYRNRK